MDIGDFAGKGLVAVPLSKPGAIALRDYADLGGCQECDDSQFGVHESPLVVEQ